MATREHADALLDAGNREAGLKELRELVEEHRGRPTYHSPIDTADLLVDLAYELRFDRRTGKTYWGKEATEAASLMEEARGLLGSSGERADHPTWRRWYSVARRLALTSGDRLTAANIVGEQINALAALGDADPETIEHLRELKRRDEHPHV